MYNFSNSCAIEFENEVVLTGSGQWGNKGFINANVLMYNQSGFVKYLPGLRPARFLHGCGYYISNNNKLVKIVP